MGLPSVFAEGQACVVAAEDRPASLNEGVGVPGRVPRDVPEPGERRREAQRRAGAICSPGLSGRGVPALRGWRRSQRRRGRLAGAKDLALGCGGAHRFPDCALASPCWPRPSGRRARPLWLQRRERREGARSLLAAPVPSVPGVVGRRELPEGQRPPGLGLRGEDGAAWWGHAS